MIKNIIKNFLIYFGYTILRSDNSALDKIQSIFKNAFVDIELIRIGNQLGDGGYLVPPVAIEIRHLVSFGVGDDVSFEQHFLDLQPKASISLFDGSIGDHLPSSFVGERVKFVPKHIERFYEATGTSVCEVFSEIEARMGDGISFGFKMDIEASEYFVLNELTVDLMSRINFMVIEFHHLDRLREQFFAQEFYHILTKLTLNHDIAHIHGNDCSKIESLNRRFSFPGVAEITFINKRFTKTAPRQRLPAKVHLLDRPNTTFNLPLPDWIVREKN